uniref:Uncharacterized protein n=2 Tax=Picea TaxID=3328 RepID=A0A101LZ62_PICGL|nr:hypothetical protein ABT39_MTgene5057 [Picea glauca]QHR89755.1 hypothetical protein Q903MT_gene3777 [Picea sitchensis]
MTTNLLSFAVHGPALSSLPKIRISYIEDKSIHKDEVGPLSKRSSSSYCSSALE